MPIERGVVVDFRRGTASSFRHRTWLETHSTSVRRNEGPIVRTYLQGAVVYAT
jgi:hypothetical protein